MLPVPAFSPLEGLVLEETGEDLCAHPCESIRDNRQKVTGKDVPRSRAAWIPAPGQPCPFPGHAAVNAPKDAPFLRWEDWILPSLPKTGSRGLNEIITWQGKVWKSGRAAHSMYSEKVNGKGAPLGHS